MTRTAGILLAIVGASQAQQGKPTVANLDRAYRQVAERKSETAFQRRLELIEQLGNHDEKSARAVLRTIASGVRPIEAAIALRYYIAEAGPKEVEEAVKRLGKFARVDEARGLELGLAANTDPAVWAYLEKTIRRKRKKLPPFTIPIVRAAGRRQDERFVDCLEDQLAWARRRKFETLELECIAALPSHHPDVRKSWDSKDPSRQLAAIRAVRARDPKASLPSEWDPSMAGNARVRRAAGSELPKPTVTMFGIAARAKRVAILVDRSGSMKAMSSPPQPIDMAVKELRSAVKRVGSDCTLNVYAFSSDVIWVGGSKSGPMKPKQRNELIERIERGKRFLPRGGTNMFGAISEAFRQDPDEIILISDGTPNTGAIEGIDVLGRVRDMNRFRGVSIHTVSFTFDHKRRAQAEADAHPPPWHVRWYLRTLAEENGGTHRDLRRPTDHAD